MAQNNIENKFVSFLQRNTIILDSHTKEKFIRSVFYIKQALIKEKITTASQKEELNEIIKVLAHSIVSSTTEIETENPGAAKKIFGFLEELEIPAALLESIKNEREKTKSSTDHTIIRPRTFLDNFEIKIAKIVQKILSTSRHPLDQSPNQKPRALEINSPTEHSLSASSKQEQLFSQRFFNTQQEKASFVERIEAKRNTAPGYTKSHK
ncbi:MAG: hypothetical protein AB8V23_00640 [Candidatus Midichloria sp.]